MRVRVIRSIRSRSTLTTVLSTRIPTKLSRSSSSISEKTKSLTTKMKTASYKSLSKTTRTWKNPILKTTHQKKVMIAQSKSMGVRSPLICRLFLHLHLIKSSHLRIRWGVTLSQFIRPLISQRRSLRDLRKCQGRHRRASRRWACRTRTSSQSQEASPSTWLRSLTLSGYSKSSSRSRIFLKLPQEVSTSQKETSSTSSRT